MSIKKKEFHIINVKDTQENPIYTNLLLSLIEDIKNSSNIVFNNDIYFKLLAKSESESNLRIDFIFPADKKVIDKYKKKKYILFTESYDTYINVTKKYISGIDPKHTKWIDNALYHNTEKILFDMPNEFIILRNYNTIDNKDILNCLGLPYIKLSCLRDLDENHVSLLEKFYNEGVNFNYKLIALLNFKLNFIKFHKNDSII